MAKKIVGFIKLQIPAGKANPSPPVGPALGQRGLNIMEFCKAFNAQTQQGFEPGMKLPVVITAFADKSFTFVIKSPVFGFMTYQKSFRFAPTYMNDASGAIWGRSQHRPS